MYSFNNNLNNWSDLNRCSIIVRVIKKEEKIVGLHIILLYDKILHTYQSVSLF